MDVERREDGRWHFSLGPVERWVAGAVAAALGVLIWWTFTGITSRQDTFSQRQDKFSQTQQQMLTQQAVTNAQLQTLSKQLSDVPGLTRQMAEMQVQVQRNQQDIHDLQQQSRTKTE
jgi:gas vesicle protein